MTAAFALPINY